MLLLLLPDCLYQRIAVKKLAKSHTFCNRPRFAKIWKHQLFYTQEAQALWAHVTCIKTRSSLYWIMLVEYSPLSEPIARLSLRIQMSLKFEPSLLLYTKGIGSCFRYTQNSHRLRRHPICVIGCLYVLPMFHVRLCRTEWDIMSYLAAIHSLCL